MKVKTLEGEILAVEVAPTNLKLVLFEVTFMVHESKKEGHAKNVMKARWEFIYESQFNVWTFGFVVSIFFFDFLFSAFKSQECQLTVLRPPAIHALFPFVLESFLFEQVALKGLLSLPHDATISPPL